MSKHTESAKGLTGKPQGCHASAFQELALSARSAGNAHPKGRPSPRNRVATSIRASANGSVTRKRSSQSGIAYKRGLEIADAVAIDSDNLITSIKRSLCNYANDPKVSYLLEQFTSKYCDESLVPAKVRASAALEKLRAAEMRNEQINSNGFSYSNCSLDLKSVLLRAAYLVNGVLGDFSFEEFYTGVRFSNGATTSRPKEFGHAYFKYSVKDTGLDVTRSALPHAIEAIRRIPGWYSYLAEMQSQFFAPKGRDVINVVSWNKVGTVPKKTDCDRATASEPDLNQFLQLSIGSMIRKRLRRIGIDLKNQTNNKNLARRGSVDNSLASIDLSSASDLNSCRLVWELLPADWLKVMDDLRAKFGKFPDGSVTRWEMFSSMGNGFTFELESLLFWALSKAASEIADPSSEAPTVSVYGDDIICPSNTANHVISVLEAVGHRPNVEKTFVDGPFRESCGGHYHNGNDITPFYVRGPIVKLTELIRLGNQIRKWSVQGETPEIYLNDVWNFIKRRVPRVFWGGRDLERSDALVTSDKPKFRLGPVRTKLCDCGVPYFFMLMQTQVDKAVDFFSDINWLREKFSKHSGEGYLYVISDVDVRVNKVCSFVSNLILSDGFSEGYQ